jgi:hypothetical protein
VTARIYEAADCGEVAFLEFCYFSACLYYSADDFVAGYHGVDGIVPFVAGLMQVGVAYSAIENVDDYIIG